MRWSVMELLEVKRGGVVESSRGVSRYMEVQLQEKEVNKKVRRKRNQTKLEYPSSGGGGDGVSWRIREKKKKKSSERGCGHS